MERAGKDVPGLKALRARRGEPARVLGAMVDGGLHERVEGDAIVGAARPAYENLAGADAAEALLDRCPCAGVGLQHRAETVPVPGRDW
jgi:hypothetical protein